MAGQGFQPDRIRRLGPDFRWPGGRRICVVFNLAFEGWSDGVAPGVGPMGNPLKPGTLDTNAINWAEYGGRRGIARLLRELERATVRASIMVNGVMAERWPEAMQAIREAGHEIVPHSMAMDIVPVHLGEAEERANLEQTLECLDIGDVSQTGWISPRGTPSRATASILAHKRFLWFGDVFDDDLPYVMDFGDHPLVAIPLTMEINDLPFVMRFGNPAPDLVPLYHRLIQHCREGEDGACYLDVTAHTHVFGRPLGAAAYAEMLASARGSDDIWVATRREVANHVLNEVSR